MFCHFSPPNLTLTSVVFELNKRSREEIFVKNLTLTSVVFESARFQRDAQRRINLTLTSVVFELNLTTDCIFT